MINKLLITFNRDSNLAANADLGEKIGNFGLGFLRIGFGKAITVEKMSDDTDKITFKAKIYSISAKTVPVALVILRLPATVLLSGIGYIRTVYSKSLRQIFNSYTQNVQPVPNQIIMSPQSGKNDSMHQKNAIPVIRLNTLESKAATTIQKHFRGYLARKSHLPSNLYSQYQVQCEKVKGSESHSIPRAQGGNTRVYLPQEMPGVVLKSSGRKNARKRFHQMQFARSILRLQNSSHLIIPKASLYQDFLVEQRLPINVDSYHNMWLYLSQLHLFDEAVRELTRLFSKAYLGDLISYQPKDPLGHIADVEDFVRYDNLPLYVVEENKKKKGKIGLIDLEHIQNGPNTQGIKDLVRIFPFHLDVIKTEAKLLEIPIDEDLLSVSAEQGKKYLQVGFIGHLQWLKEKGVSTEPHLQPFQFSSHRVKELIPCIEQELLRLNQGINDLFAKKKYMGNPQKNFFTENPEEMAQELAQQIVPLILCSLKTLLDDYQNKQLSKIKSKTLTDPQLVSLRSPIIYNPEKLYTGVIDLISEDQRIKLDEPFFEAMAIAEQLTHVLMNELVKSGDIFYFDPAYYPSSLCWIRY